MAFHFAPDVGTTLAFVNLDESGDRSFCFYRKPGADIMLSPDDIDTDIIDRAKILHFGSLSMTNEPSKSATLKALKYAKRKGKIISYDPNYRSSLWNNEETAIESMKLGFQYADIVKISDEELSLICGGENYAQNTARLIDGEQKRFLSQAVQKAVTFVVGMGKAAPALMTPVLLTQLAAAMHSWGQFYIK